MKNTSVATVVLLVDSLERICLAPKKEHIHNNGQKLEGSILKWNGYGGKQEFSESVPRTAIRELFDESTVIGKIEDLELVAKINFFWPGPESSFPDMVVYFFFLRKFEGEPKEGIREMGAPKFFSPSEIPYSQMMPADRLFFPKILAGRKIVWDIFLGMKDEEGLPICRDWKTIPSLPQ